jgi:hypothetical protein
VSLATRAGWRAAVAARPTLFAVGSYVLVAVLMLAPALWPGRTVVPADIVNLFEPWYATVSSHDIRSPLTSDAGLQFYPWFDFLGASVRAGHLPEWNPHLLGGVPFTPNGYVTSYYPPYLLAALLDPLDAYTVFVVLHLAIAAIGVYAFSRVLGARPLAAWIGGLCAFGALHWVHWSLHLNHSTGMAWLPGVLAAGEWTIQRPGRRSVAVLGLVFALWWLGGGLQYTYFGSLALVAYLAFSVGRRLRLDRRAGGIAAGALGAGFGLGALLAAPVLLPTAAISDTIVRSGDPVGHLSLTHLPRIDLLLLVVPDARGNPVADVLYRGYPYGWALDTPFVGVVALMLACVGVATLRRRHLALALGAGAVLLLGFSGWPHELLHGLVPGYNRFRVSSRWLSVLPAFALPLAALGADALLGGRRRAKGALYVAAGMATAAILSYAGWVAADASSPKGFFSAVFAGALAPLAVVVAAALLVARRRELAVVLLVGAVLFEAGVHGATWYPYVRESEAYPRLPFADAVGARGGRMMRVAAEHTQLGPFPPDLPLQYRLSDAQGQDVLFPAVYDRYLRLIEDFGNYVSDTNTAPPLTDPRRLESPLVKALDVRTAVVEPAVAMPPGSQRVASDGIDAYAVSSPGPAVLVPRAEPATEDEMWRRIADPAWDPTASAAVVGLPEPVRGGRGSVTELVRSDDGDEWRVDAPRGGLLRVSGNYDDGWKATIDGRGAPVLLADGIFRSVVVPPGMHVVRFAYANRAEHRGRILGALGLVVVVALLLPVRRLRGRGEAPA